MATQAIAADGFEMTPRRGHQQSLAEHNALLMEAQRRARRGPTPEVFFSKHFDNSRLVKAADPVRVREMRIFAAAMVVLFSLVMVYGWQHFSSIQMGYRVEAEKQQRDQLREQNRRLRLEQDQLASLDRLDREARRLGLEAPRPGQVVRPDGASAADATVVAEARPPAR